MVRSMFSFSLSHPSLTSAELTYKNKYVFMCIQMFLQFYSSDSTIYIQPLCLFFFFPFNIVLEIIPYYNIYSCSVLLSAQYTTVKMYPRHLNLLLQMDIFFFYHDHSRISILVGKTLCSCLNISLRKITSCIIRKLVSS